ncbi:MAG: Nramp family divalent metal transporter [Candidatus Latescibacteria bacterium]|nr:Nramp family divalent metal transporter [Candidatus Latescibacterota bacterium]
MVERLTEDGTSTESVVLEHAGGKRKQWVRNLLLFLTVAGPGIITANVDNDAGGITTYSVAGAHFGFRLLWSLVPITVALIVVQEMCARMGVVTGKGLSDLIRERFGVKITFYLMVCLLMTNIGNAASNFAGVAASLGILGITKYVTVPLSALLIWIIIVKGTYQSVERIFLVACLFYIAYVISGFLAKPPWRVVGQAFLQPEFSAGRDEVVMLIGLVGTTIAPWMQFYQQAAVVEKGIALDHYRYSRWDTVVGCAVVNLIAFFIIVACAATLFQAGVRIETAQDAALSLRPLAGPYCSLLFAFGLLNASLFAASILPLSTAYTICESMGWEAGVDKRFFEAPQFYGLYSFVILVGVGIVLLPGIPLIPIMLFSQVVNGLLLPFVLICMLILINDHKLMGAYVNRGIFNVIVWATVVVMIVLTVMMVVTSIWG